MPVITLPDIGELNWGAELNAAITAINSAVDNGVLSVAGRTGAVVLTKADSGLGNVDNTADTAKPVSTAQQTALNLKANIASPTFTGVPAAPTPAAGTNTTQVATTAFVTAAVAAGGGGGGAVSSVAGRTGAVVLAQSDIANLVTDLAGKGTKIATAGSVKATTGANAETDIGYTPVATAGTIMQRTTGGVVSVGTPTATDHATTKSYVDTAASSKVNTVSTVNVVYATNGSGADVPIPFASNAATPSTIVYRGTDGTTSVGTPTANIHATTKLYVDTADATKVTGRVITQSAYNALGAGRTGGLYIISGA